MAKRLREINPATLWGLQQIATGMANDGTDSCLAGDPKDRVAAATTTDGQEVEMEESNLAVVGHGLPRIDGRDKATGKAQFTVDVVLPRMLHAKFLRSPYPHARLLHIDTSRAERLAGVKGILTGRDTGHMRYAFVDTPRYPADEAPLATDRVRYIGDEIAFVAAVDEATAEEAVQLIRVEYEPLPAVFDPEEAMRPEAPTIHDEEVTGGSAWEDWGARRTATSRPHYEFNNLSGRTSVSFGNIEQGFQESDYVRWDRFECKATAHCAMEPHAVVASYDHSKLNVWLSSMGIFYKRFILAKILGLPLHDVHIHKTFVGGAFGGKMDLYPYEILAGFMAKRLGQPVRVELTREEVFTTTRQRHPVIIELKTGVKRDGTLVAQDFRFIADNGAYRGTGPVVIFLGYAYNIPVYRVPNYRYEGYSVYTNNPVRGPQRGHGAPQVRFAVDSQLDMICRELGLDLVEVMLKNARQPGDVIPSIGDPLLTCGLSETILKASKAIGWKTRHTKAATVKRGHPTASRFCRGIGISACSMFSGANYYPFASAAVIKMHDNGAATLFSGATEMGQGCDTTLSQVAAEELGVPLSDIRLVSGDTELCPIDMGSFLSGGALVTGSAVRQAAADAKRQMLEIAAELLEADVDDLVASGQRIYVKGAPERGLSYGQIIQASVQRRNGDPIIGKGSRKACVGAQHYPSLAKAKGRWTDAYGFSATAAEVEVDTLSGEVRVLQMATVHDCGRALNRQIVEGQIHGCISMGLGQTLCEQIVLEKGHLLNPNFQGYLIPLASETPEIAETLVETNDPHGPYGAKEAGEGSVAGVPAAIANAVADAINVRITSLPITPQKILAALESRQR